MDRIDRQASQIICENVQIPDEVSTNPAFVKCTLLVLRGMAVPGDPIRFDREELRMRTQLKKRSQENAISALLEIGFLIQTEKPAHGRSAEYKLDHDAMIQHVPEAALDRAAGRIKALRKRQTDAPGAHVGGGTDAPGASERVQELQPSTAGTCAPGAPTDARPAPTDAPGAPTSAAGAHAIKEETAIPAKPAAAAAQPPVVQQISADTLLENAAAAAAFMDQAGWERLGKQAGLDRDIAQQCARVITEFNVMSVERGLKAMERLCDRMKGNDVRSPTGYLVTQLKAPGGPDDNPITNRRHRATKHRRDQFRQSFVSRCGNRQWFEQVRYRTQRLLRSYVGEEAMNELMPNDRFRQRPGDWPAMLDFMATHWESICEMEVEDVA